MTTQPAPSLKEEASQESDRLGLLGRAASLKNRGMPTPTSVVGIEQSLEAHNPVAVMPQADFLKLLAMFVECEKFAHGKPRTKTAMTLSAGLEVLTGRKPFEHIKSLVEITFSLGELTGLKHSPMAAFCYRRVVSDVAALQSKMPEAT